MEAHLRAGMAVFNAGGYHTAHDCWEDRWLDLDSGSEDELLLHGLIQYTAAVYHARQRNWTGATGLADSAREYLDGLPVENRGVDIAAVRTYLEALGRDPERIERRRPLTLTHDGSAVLPDDLGIEATAVAARALAEARGEADLLDRAIEFARADVDGTAEPDRGETDSRVLPLVFDYVREPDRRGVVVRRLEQHTERRQAKVDDVAGLFEPSE